jgi:hypothetical protein
MNASCGYQFDGGVWVLFQTCDPPPSTPDKTICPTPPMSTFDAVGTAVNTALGTPSGSFSFQQGDTVFYDCLSSSNSGDLRVWFDRTGGATTGPAIHKVFTMSRGQLPSFTEIAAQPRPPHKPQVPRLKLDPDGSLEPLPAAGS